MRAAILLFALCGSAAADGKVPQYTIWDGSYTCVQGLTALRLTVETSEKGGAASGHFVFGPHTGNPNVPHGDYWLRGSAHVNAHDELVVKLVPDKWKSQPAGYVMVGLTATSDREQRTMTGTIDFEGCTTLSVTRINPEMPDTN